MSVIDDVINSLLSGIGENNGLGLANLVSNMISSP